MEWPEVERAKEGILRMGPRGFDLLLHADVPEESVQLHNTMDTHYPGGPRGDHRHGSFLAYELDYLPARVGWCVEKLALKEFGFRIEEFPWGTAATALGPGPISGDAYTRPKEQYRNALARARSWWEGERGSWSRARALAEALRGDSQWFALIALSNIRNERDKELRIEPGLRTTFFTQVLPAVIDLLDSGDDTLVRYVLSLLREDYCSGGLWRFDEKVAAIEAREPPVDRFRRLLPAYWPRFGPENSENERRQWKVFWLNIESRLASEAWPLPK
jgi:hypothetical protein